MSLWQIGLLIFLVAGAVNSLLVRFDVGGIPREFARLSVLVGLVVFITGLIKRKKVK